MTIVSYAQNYEDVMLWRALGHVRDGFFIDIGAAWPEHDSVTRLFKDHGWRGVNVEPNPDLHRQLVECRPDDINLAVAVADERSTMVMDIVRETGLSTLSHEVGGRYRREGRDVLAVTVDVVTLAGLWREHVAADQAVQFLKVDVEGFESQVLAGADWEHHRPWIVLVEATRPTSQVESYEAWEPYLVDAGYAFAYADGINRFYIADEQAELLDSFRYPPNVFDGFITAAHDAAERRAAAGEVSTIEERHRAEVAVDGLTRTEARVSWVQSEWDATAARLAQSQASAAEMHRRIGGLDVLIGERERALASTTAQLHTALHRAAETAQSNQNLRQESNQLRQESNQLHAEVERQSAVIAHLDRHIGDMYASTSWRFTAPVRLAGAVGRGLRRLPARLLRRDARRPQPGPSTDPGSAASETTETLEQSHIDRSGPHSSVADADLPASAHHLLRRLMDETQATREEPVR